MVSGRSMQLTKQVGEYLVAAELCRRGLIATTFTGNVPTFDILAINRDYETIPIQVKTIRGRTWQFNAREFLSIDITNGVQTVAGKTDLPYPDLICVFVKLVEDGRDRFYVFQLKALQELIFQDYGEFLRKKGGIRPRNRDSTHTAVRPASLAEFEDNWELILGERA
ncbi:MAG TPA: hypothetical protein VMX14_02735 [Anaerolineae bacterium]|nr:hypothetical protein [Anaerolineae bacterium]